MTDPRPAASASTRDQLVSSFLAFYLVGSFLWRVLVPAHEYAMRSAQVLGIGIDILGIVGLCGLRDRIPKPLFYIALIAGLGLLGIRFTSDHGWWTGHLSYSLAPR